MKKFLYSFFAFALSISIALAPSAAIALPVAQAIAPDAALSLQSVERAYAAESNEYVFDEYGILDDEQAKRLEAKAQEIAEKYQIGIYLVTVDDVGSMTAQRYAEKYYVDHNLGIGSMDSGVMLLLAVESRDYWIVTRGDGHGSTEIGKAGAIDAFTDARIDSMGSDLVADLRYNRWSDAADTYYDEAAETIEYLFANGEPMQNSSSYHNTRGSEEDEEFDGFMGWIIKILGILGFPAIVASGIVSGEKKSMQNAEIRHEASDYLDVGSLNLIKSEDRFINTTMAVVPLATVDDDNHDGGRFGGGFGGFGNSSISSGGFGGGGGKF